MYTSRFKFHGNLADFIELSGKDSSIPYTFAGHPSLKDAIEALGVPHPEIQEIKANGQVASLSEPLQQESFIEVFPFAQIMDIPMKFILDVHLGKLARLLRLLGFDVWYSNHYSDNDIINLIEKEQRIVLTRDIGLLKQKAVVWGYWPRSQDSFEQLEEVMYRYQLKKSVQPFSRCILCNGKLITTEKANVLHLIPPRTQIFYNEFYQCQDCKKVYWKGSHYERMLQQIKCFI
ncbi:MAG TPA: Mut7-C RNAse domain-containing protein [Flavisolibacter sp.]|nr:Mut7-C RNAse domain-containing protein [Flavisolibacter sp.]